MGYITLFSDFYTGLNIVEGEHRYSFKNSMRVKILKDGYKMHDFSQNFTINLIKCHNDTFVTMLDSVEFTNGDIHGEYRMRFKTSSYAQNGAHFLLSIVYFGTEIYYSQKPFKLFANKTSVIPETSNKRKRVDSNISFMVEEIMAKKIIVDTTTINGIVPKKIQCGKTVEEPDEETQELLQKVQNLVYVNSFSEQQEEIQEHQGFIYDMVAPAFEKTMNEFLSNEFLYTEEIAEPRNLLDEKFASIYTFTTDHYDFFSTYRHFLK